MVFIYSLIWSPIYCDFTVACQSLYELSNCAAFLSNSHVDAIELFLYKKINYRRPPFSYAKSFTFICSTVETSLVDDSINSNSSFSTREKRLSPPKCPAPHSYPVCRSPMINSRCPRPMGTKLSTAFSPVCMGSLTEIRGIIPGAFNPTRRLSAEVMGP